MFFKLNKIKRYIRQLDGLIKAVEYVRGIYKYPNNMIGRINNLNKTTENIDILVIAAHPDDEILGLSTTLYREQLNGKNIVIAFVTNGSCWDKQSWRIRRSETLMKSMIRYKEASKALSLIGIPQDHIICLGFPDAGTHRYVENIGADIYMLINQLKPGSIYVHCIEGGHNDHDISSFIVKVVCKEINFTNVYEWTEYHPKQPIGTENVNFLPSSNKKLKEKSIVISKTERRLKKMMLACHKSQDVERFYLQGEAIRKANLYNMEDEILTYCQLPKNNIIRLIKTKISPEIICKKKYDLTIEREIKERG